MENRIPTYPGRFLVERADGSQEYMTLQLADEPIDEGTILSKATLLPDYICSALNINERESVPKDALEAMLRSAPWSKIADYASAGSIVWSAPDLFEGKPYVIGVMVIGGGGSGGALIQGRNEYYGIFGGASGYSTYGTLTVWPGMKFNIIAGSGGMKKSITSAAPASKQGDNGGTSSFGGILVALGGEGGKFHEPMQGGQPSINYDDNSLFGGDYTNSGSFDVLRGLNFTSCYNPFECKRILGAGRYAWPGGEDGVFLGGKDPITGLGAGNSVKRTNDNAIAYDADSPGCGGGASAIYNESVINAYTSTSGGGADGAVYVYVRERVL